ncbi:MAG: hypothetical protein U5S82_24135 [Gammaproteobacteria bacterium]|nr:hypothetical protein [Gammaproteobacteria bacterium]
MKRNNLEHPIRAAGAITQSQTIIVLGSQSILGKYPDAPNTVLMSMEADLIPAEHPDRWNLLDGTIGEMSPFHESFGYYADGVEESTAVLPAKWPRVPSAAVAASKPPDVSPPAGAAPRSDARSPRSTQPWCGRWSVRGTPLNT